MGTSYNKLGTSRNYFVGTSYNKLGTSCNYFVGTSCNNEACTVPNLWRLR